MYNNEFNHIIDHSINMAKKTLLERGEEYATEDRLHNFRVAAELQGTTMREALAGMMAKHTTSIYDMVQDPIDAHNKHKWDEKIGDHINYLLILQAVLYDERSTDVVDVMLPFSDNN